MLLGLPLRPQVMLFQMIDPPLLHLLPLLVRALLLFLQLGLAFAELIRSQFLIRLGL